MSVTIAPVAETDRRLSLTLRARMQGLVPKLVLAPSFLLVLIFVYGFNLWTVFLSFTNSRAFASSKLIGFANYEKLWNWTFETDPPSSWYTAIVNIGIFGGLYIVFCLALGLTLAILLDQKIRGEGILRPIYLDRKSTRLNSSHSQISYAVFCLKKKNTTPRISRALRAACCTTRCSRPGSPGDARKRRLPLSRDLAPLPSAASRAGQPRWPGHPP